MYWRRSRFLRSVVLPFALVAFLSACTGWQYETVEHPAPYESLALGEPEEVTVTLDDGRQVDLRHPFIRTDSIIGIGTVYDERNIAWKDTVRIALAEVSITIHHEQQPISDFLDDVCGEIGCEWTLDSGEKPRPDAQPLRAVRPLLQRG